jgi:predicted ArsR family transcriptional regulator
MPHEQLIPARRRRIDRQAEQHRLLGDPARLIIMEAVTDQPRLIAELVALTGLHRNTVRAHLARMIAAGLVTAERREPVGPGRPATRYRLREGLGIPGTEQRLLIRSLLRMVSGASGSEAAGLAEEEGRRIGRQIGASLEPPNATRALTRVIEMLRELAFAPEVTSTTGVSQIALHHCPFAVSADDPRGGIICAFHLGLMRGVVDAAGPPGQHDVWLLPHVAPHLCRAEIRFA